jgi:hypothetical protein
MPAAGDAKDIVQMLFSRCLEDVVVAQLRHDMDGKTI